MSIEDIATARRLIEANAEDADFDGPKDPALVAAAERALGVTFSPSYREFLTTMGCGSVAGFEVYGIINDDFENSSVPDMVWVTRRNRPRGLPENYLIIGDSGDGGHLVLDAAAGRADGEHPVLLWQRSGATEVLGQDFGRFFLAEVQAALDVES